MNSPLTITIPPEIFDDEGKETKQEIWGDIPFFSFSNLSLGIVNNTVDSPFSIRAPFRMSKLSLEKNFYITYGAATNRQFRRLVDSLTLSRSTTLRIPKEEVVQAIENSGIIEELREHGVSEVKILKHKDQYVLRMRHTGNSNTTKESVENFTKDLDVVFDRMKTPPDVFGGKQVFKVWKDTRYHTYALRVLASGVSLVEEFLLFALPLVEKIPNRENILHTIKKGSWFANDRRISMVYEHLLNEYPPSVQVTYSGPVSYINYSGKNANKRNKRLPRITIFAEHISYAKGGYIHFPINELILDLVFWLENLQIEGTKELPVVKLMYTLYADLESNIASVDISYIRHMYTIKAIPIV